MDTVENALSQRTVVTIEMMPASRADDLCLSVKQATCGVILVSAIEALNHGWISARQLKESHSPLPAPLPQRCSMQRTALQCDLLDREGDGGIDEPDRHTQPRLIFLQRAPDISDIDGQDLKEQMQRVLRRRISNERLWASSKHQHVGGQCDGGLRECLTDKELI